MNISKHIENLERDIKLIKLLSKVRFGVWCIWPILNDRGVICFLNKVKSPNYCESLKAILVDLYLGNRCEDKGELRSFVEGVEAFDWDHDGVAESEECASQGAMDLLGGISSLINGCIEGRDDYFANCAEVAINRLYYLVDFEILPEYLLDKEADNQVVAMNSLLNDGEDALSLDDRDVWGGYGL
ncbi:hypothetical protein [Pectobacterium sp. IFB5596]|uniref:hypothetical protein n=1 Tax=Pectobacterium sp. IFB5596 TaxID=1839803 RepID=UPI001F1C835D|nr:hypothetical protein [Pectobacterium sp. IFB5596]MCE9732382.1 hypothetical protein [Pectobacterium sp. IFB5596]